VCLFLLAAASETPPGFVSTQVANQSQLRADAAEAGWPAAGAQFPSTSYFLSGLVRIALAVALCVFLYMQTPPRARARASPNPSREFGHLVRSVLGLLRRRARMSYYGQQQAPVTGA
jgi:hypothetical protein